MFRLTSALRMAALGFALALAGVCTARAATLPPAPVPAESFDVGMLHVDRFGSGAQSLILIPGLGSGEWTWYGTIAHFSPQYTIYAITLPGFNGRPPTSQTPLFPAFAADFWKLLAQRKIVSPVVIGHSLGGTLSFLLGEQHPERLRGIVAVDGLPIFPTIANKTPQERETMAAQMAASYASLTPAQTLAYETAFMKTIGTRDPGLVDQTAELEAASDPKAVAAWLREDLVDDLRPDLSKIDVPLLEIMPYDPQTAAQMGGFTQDQGIAFYKGLIAGTPKSAVEPIAPARHFAMLDQPDSFYALITAFLGALLPPPSSS